MELGWNQDGSRVRSQDGAEMEPGRIQGWSRDGAGMEAGSDPGTPPGAHRTYMVMDMLAAESGLTSATSFAFCSASFWLAASSSSCSSCKAPAPCPAWSRGPGDGGGRPRPRPQPSPW